MSSSAEPVPSQVGAADTSRRPSIWLFLALVVVYVAIAQGMTLVLRDEAGADTSTVNGLVARLIIPVTLATAVLLIVMTVLRSWQRTFVETKTFQRWTMVIPLLLLVLVLAVTNYSGLAQKGALYSLLLLVSMCIVGFAEELLYRGIGVDAFRSAGFSEVQVGLWTSAIFGASHLTNIVVSGPGALLQAVRTFGTGFMFYLVMRVTGALLGAAIAHALWNFMTLSNQADPANPSNLVNLAPVALVIILVIVLVFRKRLNPPATP